MTIKELKDLLSKLDDDTVVVINKELVSGVEVVAGKIKEGYYNKTFVESHKPPIKNYALMFTKWEEISTGEVLKVII